MTKLPFAMLIPLVLAACDTVAPAELGFGAVPFENGVVTVVTVEHDELRSYQLRPCAQTAVCGARRGSLTVADGIYGVSGAYHGRRFDLTAGGGGTMLIGNKRVPLAWD